MMETPLNSWLLFDHSPRYAPETELVSRTPSGDVERTDLRRLRPAAPSS